MTTASKVTAIYAARATTATPPNQTTSPIKAMRPYALMFGLCLTANTVASEPLVSESELYTPLVNAYESDLLEKRAALSKCVTTACAVYAQLDITRLNSKLVEIKAIYAHIAPEKALVQSLSNEIYAAKEGK